MSEIQATRVWELARREGWSMPELARRMGVSRQYVYFVRSGQRTLGAAFIRGARRAFPGYPLDWLFPADPIEPRREAV